MDICGKLEFSTGFHSGDTRPPLTHRFQIDLPGEVVATIAARCARCDWGLAGREAAGLTLSIDGRYSQHLLLVRGEESAEYRVMLGSLTAGPHTLDIDLDRDATARATGPVSIDRIDVALVDRDSPEYLALASAPILHARPNTLGRFTDTPLLMWYETEPSARGRWLRYSVVFSNEDGGTPTDRLMATWGRATDIEYVYGVEIDEGGAILAEEFQGPKHEVRPFRGARAGRHPLLWVATENNMVLDAGDVTQRYAPAPLAFTLDGTSREAVMDAHPWTYAVMAREMAREGKIADAAAPASGAIPDLRTFVFVEACGEVAEAAHAFAVRVEPAGRTAAWFESDGGVAEFRITRTGCFRGAVATPDGRVTGLRFRAYERPPQEGRARAHTPRVTITRVNRVFRLGRDFTPGPSLMEPWKGSLGVVPGGPPVSHRP